MTKKSFIKTIGSKGLLSDYNTEGKKLLTEDSIDQTYSSTSTKAQSGVAVNEAFKTRETSTSDDSYTYLGMDKTYKGTEELYWKLVSFKTIDYYWTLQFEVDVSNGRKGNSSGPGWPSHSRKAPGKTGGTRPSGRLPGRPRWRTRYISA